MTRGFALTIAIYLGTFMVTLDISIVNLALPRMQQALQTDMAGLQWMLWMPMPCACRPLCCPPDLLGDRYGRKKSWLLGVLAFTVGSMMCALADSLSALLWGRIVQGMAGALLITGCALHSDACLSRLCSTCPSHWRLVILQRPGLGTGPDSGWGAGRCGRLALYLQPESAIGCVDNRLGDMGY